MLTQNFSPLFYRRIDLTMRDRLRIACISLLFTRHGSITKLADKYRVSRSFIYELREKLLDIGQKHFDAPCQAPISDQDDRPNSLSWILSLRLEGKSPIEGISSVLKRFGIPYNSVGFISQELQRIGDLQDNVLESPVGEGIRVAFCCDEIFAKGQAILITVDPISLAILQIELSENHKGETWASHWTRLLSAGYSPICLCNDEGTGMAAGQISALGGVARQSDTYHGVAHRLGTWVERLEKRAFKHIEEEYECERLVSTAKSEATRNRRIANYQKAAQKAQASIALSDDFAFLYQCLLEAFHIFDSKGILKDRDKVLADFDTALDWMKTLGEQGINKEIKSIELCKTALFQFMFVAQQVVKQLSEQVPTEVLKTLCSAWQMHRNAIKAKQSGRKNAFKRHENRLLLQLELADHNTDPATDNQTSILKKLVYEQLDTIVQSSAAVECINAILRPYLNTSKNQVSQSALNLFMAYHNSRRFKAGKRKGKTPYEILMGQTQHQDWIEIMLAKAA